jgi:hypothetical protein
MMTSALPPRRPVAGIDEGEGMLRLLHRIIYREEGQGTVEYVLVILAAAAIALSLIAWISDTNLFSGLFGTILKKVIGFAK